MAANWIRGKEERPRKRRVVLIYDTASTENAVLEQLVDRIPYGEGNKVFLQCLRLGAATVLAQLDGGAAGQPTAAQALSKPALQRSAPTPQPNSFSNAAKRMFEGSEGTPLK